MIKMLPLRERIRRFIIGAGIVFYLFTSFIVAAVESEKMKDYYASAMITTVTTCGEIIRDYLNQYHEYIQHVIEEVPDYSEDGIIKYMQDNLHFQNFKDIFYILDPSNTIIFIQNPYGEYRGINLSHIGYIAKGVPVSRVHQSLFSQQPVVSFLYQLGGDKLIVFEKSLEGIIPLAQHFNLGEILKGSYLFILSSNGTVVYHPDKQLIESRHNLGFELTNWSRPDSRGLQTFTYHTKRYLCYRSTLEEPIGWSLYFVVPNAELLKTLIYRIGQIFVIFAVVFLFLTFFLQFMVNRKFSNPVSEIVATIANRKLDGSDQPIDQGKGGGTKELTSIIDAVNSLTTRLSRSQEILRESEERYRTLVEAMRDVVFTLDTKRRFIFLNRAFKTMTGYAGKDFIGRPFTKILAPEYVESTNERFRRGLAGGEIPIYEVEIICKDQERITVELHVTSLLDAHGKSLGRIGVAWDISERRKAEEALKEAYDIISKSPTIAFLWKNAEGWPVEFVTDNVEGVFGYTAEEFLSGAVLFRKTIHPDDLDRVKKEIAHYTSETGTRSFAHEPYRIITKDGRVAWVDNRTYIRRDERGLITHYQGIVVDITDRKRIETQLQQARKLEAIGTLAGGIAHDFNNLLMAIIGNTSLMLLEADSAHPFYDRLKDIERHVQSGSMLTKQLLGFARGGMYEVKSLNLNAVIQKSAEMFSRTKKEIAVHTKYQDDLWPVEGDQGQIEQVFLNLYVNAWQAMPGGGEIYLESENSSLDAAHAEPLDIEPGRYVKITVTDTGVGMDEDTQQRIFDPFFTTKEMGRGTGLGLASVYGIIQNHRGIITVDSEKGNGTTFTIYLRASDKQPEEERAVSEQLIKGSGTILLVDDEERVLNVGKDMLAAIGYKVLTANSGKEAIDVFRKNQHILDVVILDMIMPGMGGSETYDGLQKINPRVKVLLSSGYSLDGKAKEILSRGYNGFIQKPFHIYELSSKLRDLF
jgi:two-component system, cell cycle sensor histidine kinase and response regulator CckA